MEVAGRRITKYGIALLGIVLIGLFLRVYHLGTQSIWSDEAFSIWISKLSLPQLIAATAGIDDHPPLYYFILHYWIMVFGTSASAVRLLSALFGVLAIPLIYVVGRQLINKEAGLVGALILALSSFNIYYSQEARMYSLMVLLALLSMYFFLRLVQRSTLASSAGYVLSTTLLVYTHYYGFFVVIAQNIYIATLLLLSKSRTYRLRHWVALQAIVFALFAPWTVVLGFRTSWPGGGATYSPVTLATIIDTLTSYAGTIVLLALFLALSVLSLFAYQKVRGKTDWKAPPNVLESYLSEVRLQDPAAVYFLSVWLIITILLALVISRISSSPYYYRYAITASVALYLLVAKGIRAINYRPAKVAVISVIILLSVVSLPANSYNITKPQAREGTSFIDANAKSGDVVLIYPYWGNLTFNYYNDRTDIVVKPIYFGGWPPVNNTEELQSDVSGHDRVWLYNSGDASFTKSFLNERYALIHVQKYYSEEVFLYEKRG